ncbi:2-alkenal reductase [Delftia acidovorans SPH-1]|uniref:2-alkenal reductase n=1 Tax=Delftia acidovorans (strain DSM 14801 / SPH-1) TaxID=398578 RepID=A9BSS2_DELAS|nr:MULTISPECIES: molecular chaperone HscC [Delftia]ABX34077.1 2-alkenal reductase [Delftia acidovorans SPH-1]MCP4017013.1 molecular chaperone HscC [Delftia sp.]OLE95525.1 MAG: molecular chaperone HscC [Delftia sp. 13_1_40CM_3_66_6]MCP4534597.1 molecular chaperone HscC [Delftia sp.]OLE05066.1 MAG: molecular chaperone HscC [Delftia sp. 13_1_20CM_4_67_18]
MFVGIDLGTTHSLVAVWQNGCARLVLNALGKVLTPSVVSVDNDGRLLVGEPARERLQSHPHLSCAVFKRDMGTARVFRLGEHLMRAEELSALVLRSLKADVEADLGAVVTDVVITVPAYFADAQRQATRAAGVLAGFANITLLNEPTAAALAYGLHRDEGRFLVFDLGGGTFDVSVLELFEGVMEVRATAGDNRLGGEDVDELMVRRFVRHAGMSEEQAHEPGVAARLRRAAEAAKRRMTVQEAAVMRIDVDGESLTMTWTLQDLEAALEPLLERMRQPVERALRDSRIRPQELDAVVLAGGSTRLLAVRQLVTRLFGRFPEVALDPDEVVALGAAVQAALRGRDKALAERVMTDVCPYTLGIHVSRELGDGRRQTGFMAPVLERNTIVPASRVKRFYPVSAKHRQINIEIYQGEARRVQDNTALGKLVLPLPQGNLDDVAIDVRFTLDANGLLEVEAWPLRGDQPQGEAKHLVIEASAERLSPEELSRCLERLQSLKLHPRDRLEVRALMARAERHHAQLLGQWRSLLADAILSLEVALETQDDRRFAQPRKRLEDLLASIEADQFLPDLE